MIFLTKFYNEAEARKYTSSSRMMEIQAAMSERAIELLTLEDASENCPPKFVLDIGCGSGLSGEVLEEHGHYWVGVDISPHMLNVARERECEGDIFLGDMGSGLFFRAGTFDAAISISALQWLCNADKKTNEPRKRLQRFFQSLYNSLVRGGKAVLQFYPENAAQMELVTHSAMKCGFSGGLVVDYPNSTKAKKYFLCLFAGIPPGGYQLPQGLGEGTEAAEPAVGYSNERRRSKRKRGDKRPAVKSKEWVKNKKESQRKKGMEVRSDSKYTARKRSGATKG